MNPDLPPACVPEDDGSCSICGDEGLLGEVLEVAPDDTGRVRIHAGGAGPPDGGAGRPGAGDEQMVALDLLEGIEPGDRVVVHMGFAIARVREDA